MTGENQITGVYAQGKGDFGFIDVENRDKGYFVFGRNSFNAMPGDTVQATAKMFKGREEAIIKKIIERRKDPIVGVYKDNKTFGFVVPNSPDFKKDFFVRGKESKNAKDGELVAIEIIKWEGKNPEGRVIKVLGKAGEKGVDIMAIALENGARMGFGDAIRKELETVKSYKNIQSSKRKDLRNLFTITIDGADSKDLDDAISVEKHENGNYILSVHIADVTHYVRENHAIDKEARRRGTSIYLVDQVIPMLPKELSNDLCSLNPHEDKLTLTCEIEVNKKGHIVNTSVYESLIKSDFRMTYKEVDEIIRDLTPNPSPLKERGVKQKMQPLSPPREREFKGEVLKEGEELLFGGKISQKLVSMLELSEELRGILSIYKKSLGVLEFDFPETKIIVDEIGNPIEFKKYERYNSNKIVEEFMVLANEAISRQYSKVPFLYRIHSKPSDDDLEKLQTTLHMFGYKIPHFTDISSKEIAEVLLEIKEDKREKLLSKMVLRSLSKAIYSEEREGHFGLALHYYSHFTSPIRRYPDLQIHRIIKDHISGRLNKTMIEHYKTILPGVAKKSSDAEVKAEKLEYKVRDLMAVKFMKDKVGESFEATVSGAIASGIFVELENTIEGFVELNPKIGRSDFVFNIDLMKMENNITGETYSIGDKVNVELTKVDDKLLRLDFALIK